ncbi:MAG: 23S rRNA (guanosine(2251)-2'-O)-methyltransferase RlmB [Gammaproteobacteria bacterium]|nr:23S rRNA (guanosine(2251)-2'-O)-methyltransferase RlmB [Gammaproteobacteria bacterium]
MNENAIIGIHSVKEAIKKQPRSIDKVFVLGGGKNRRLAEIAQLALKAELPILEISRAELDRLAKGSHQGVIANLVGSDHSKKGGIREEQVFNYLKDNESQLILVLDGVTDPHNLGACMRTADAAGVGLIIIPRDKSASLNPTVRKVASGAAETVELVSVTNLARFLEKLKQHGFWIVGADDQAEKSIYDQDFKGEIAVVLGSEGQGLRRLTKEKCDFLISIPMSGDLSSLNVSVAAGVVLFEAVRQRSGV